MDFKDTIKQLTERVEKLKKNLQTEEATKNALIMPFIQALGYDVFNPLEVVPEFTCDIGTKKGEKVDYAIMKDGEPVMLIECKHCNNVLDLSNEGQLLRYFTVSKAKFGLLTNGVVFRFYTDLEKTNVMDEKPFLEIDLQDLRNNQVEELKKFHKTYFDIENILSSASEMKYTNILKSKISEEFANPSPDFVRFFTKQVYESIVTPKVLEQFTTLVRRSISLLISDIISERLKTALKTETAEAEEVEEHNKVTDEQSKGDNIKTTGEELEGFYIIKAILRNHIASERITYRDAVTYFAIFIDDNNRKPVCRLYLNSQTNKQICLFNGKRDNRGRLEEIRYKLNSLDEIYNYSEQLIALVKKY
jgi:hypothetical protein